jgi:hypothetical protein
MLRGHALAQIVDDEIVAALAAVERHAAAHGTQAYESDSHDLSSFCPWSLPAGPDWRGGPIPMKLTTTSARDDLRCRLQLGKQSTL